MITVLRLIEFYFENAKFDSVNRPNEKTAHAWYLKHSKRKIQRKFNLV